MLERHDGNAGEGRGDWLIPNRFGDDRDTVIRQWISRLYSFDIPIRELVFETLCQTLESESFGRQIIAVTVRARGRELLGDVTCAAHKTALFDAIRAMAQSAHPSKITRFAGHQPRDAQPVVVNDKQLGGGNALDGGNQCLRKTVLVKRVGKIHEYAKLRRPPQIKIDGTILDARENVKRVNTGVALLFEVLQTPCGIVVRILVILAKITAT